MIGEAYARWINPYRDLPILGNQWANIVRWEMRPRLFTHQRIFMARRAYAHATKDEAIFETEKMLEVYRVLCEDFGYAGDLRHQDHGGKIPRRGCHLCIESMMQDARPCRPAHRTFWVKILQKPLVSLFSRRRERKNMDHIVGDYAFDR